MPKYKRCKVSFRDFPEGCGPYISRVDPDILGQTIESSLEDAEVATPAEEAVKYGQYTAKAMTRKRKRKFFYRRRVSAVRDFPPLCGKTVSHLSEGESLEGDHAMENKCMVQQHMDAEQVEKNVEDGHAYNGRLTDVVHGDSEGNDVEKEKKLDVFGKCITISEESDQDQVEINSKTIHEGNGVAVQFEGTSRQDILV